MLVLSIIHREYDWLVRIQFRKGGDIMAESLTDCRDIIPFIVKGYKRIYKFAIYPQDKETYNL